MSACQQIVAADVRRRMLYVGVQASVWEMPALCCDNETRNARPAHEPPAERGIHAASACLFQATSKLHECHAPVQGLHVRILSRKTHSNPLPLERLNKHPLSFNPPLGGEQTSHVDFPTSSSLNSNFPPRYLGATRRQFSCNLATDFPLYGKCEMK